MRMKSRIACVVVLGFVVGHAATAGATSGVIPRPVRDATWKLMRGLTNTVLGLPGEIAAHVLGGLAAPQSKTVGAGISGAASGLVIGSAVGVERVVSGIVDIGTFPIPIDDNRPLLEPEFPF